MPSQTSAAWLGLAGLLIASTLPAQAKAATLHVATNATHNGSGCGAAESPCRSISRAVINATPGDLIEVGPGIYGDIDGDGDATSAGEEAIVRINKVVTVYSSEGAAQTIIRAPRSLTRTFVVVMSGFGDGATFGRLGEGFTIVGDDSNPQGAIGVLVNMTNATIAGNVATKNAGAGFIVQGAGARVEGNTASDNGDIGFILTDADFTATDNLATRNLIGFQLNGPWTSFTGNRALANAEFGVLVNDSPNSEVVGVSLIGNGVAGIRFAPSALGPLVIHGSNIFGNGEAAIGCGLLNESNAFVNATDNYWGKASGPGPNPGDRASGDCVGSGGRTLAIPFATVPFPI